MKDKRATIILLAAVGLVWGFALYQIISGFMGGEEPVYKKKASVQVQDLVVENDSFNLRLNYRDPFLGKLPAMAAGSTTRPVQVRSGRGAKPVPPKKQEPVLAPVLKPDVSFVNYIGLIKNQKTGKEVSLVSIHGRDYFMLEGQTEKEVTLLKNRIDSIQIQYKEEQFFIKR